MLGYSYEEARLMNIADVIRPEVVARIQDEIAGSATKVIGAVYELEITAKDGHRVPLEVSMRVVSARGQAVEIEGIAVPSILRTEAQAKKARCLDDDFLIAI